MHLPQPLPSPREHHWKENGPRDVCIWAWERLEGWRSLAQTVSLAQLGPARLCPACALTQGGGTPGILVPLGRRGCEAKRRGGPCSQSQGRSGSEKDLSPRPHGQTAHRGSSVWGRPSSASLSSHLPQQAVRLGIARPLLESLLRCLWLKTTRHSQWPRRWEGTFHTPLRPLTQSA